MKTTSRLFVILVLLCSCNQKVGVIEDIDFESGYELSSEIEDQVAKDTIPWKYQISAYAYAEKGGHKNALAHWDLATNPNEQDFTKKQKDSVNKKYSVVNAKDYIIKEARKNRITIINEAHHNSSHRTFTKSLLKELYDIGYKNLGLEALYHKENLDSLQQTKDYPLRDSGYYIRDPQFGNLIREAIEIGYSVFPYEIKDEEKFGKFREIDQAKNIQRIIEAKPNEKFLIHCGYQHVMEGTHEMWEKAMAGRLSEYTGIDPLTITQVEYSEKSDPKFNTPLFKALEINESSILIDKEKKPFGFQYNSSWADLAVFHPNTEYIDNRPNWLFTNGNKNTPIALNDIEIEFPVMVLAFKKGEDINLAVPYDITEVKNKTDSCNLALKKGSYEIVVTNGKKSLKFTTYVK